MRASFLAAMATAVTGVHVATTSGAGGRLGLTVSSMASVSADPPMLLVCVNRRSPVATAIDENGSFAVNTLGVHQAAVADTFAGRRPSGRPFDFDSARWEIGATGSPLLVGAAARFDCDVAATVEAGSHLIVVGAVRGADHGRALPLAYAGRAYARPAPLAVHVRTRADRLELTA